MASPLFQEVSESVRKQLKGFQALALVSLDGGVVEQLTADSTLNPDTLSEFATILRIAQHTSEDTAAGQLTEMSWTADRSLVLARRVAGESFLILAGSRNSVLVSPGIYSEELPGNSGHSLRKLQGRSTTLICGATSAVRSNAILFRSS